MHLLHPLPISVVTIFTLRPTSLEHLLNCLHDALIVGRRGKQGDLSFSGVTNFSHKLFGLFRIIFWCFDAFDKPKDTGEVSSSIGAS